MKTIRERFTKYFNFNGGGDDDDRSIILIPTTKTQTSVGIILLTLIIIATYVSILRILTILGLSLMKASMLGLVLLVLIYVTAFVGNILNKQFIKFTKTLVD